MSQKIMLFKWHQIFNILCFPVFLNRISINIKDKYVCLKKCIPNLNNEIRKKNISTPHWRMNMISDTMLHENEKCDSDVNIKGFNQECVCSGWRRLRSMTPSQNWTRWVKKATRTPHLSCSCYVTTWHYGLQICRERVSKPRTAISLA